MTYRHYFVLQTNPGEQFYVFSLLCTWLIQKCGIFVETPQEYDDPNSTIASILNAARQLVSNHHIIYIEYFLLLYPHVRGIYL